MEFGTEERRTGQGVALPFLDLYDNLDQRKRLANSSLTCDHAFVQRIRSTDEHHLITDVQRVSLEVFNVHVMPAVATAGSGLFCFADADDFATCAQVESVVRAAVPSQSERRPQ